MISQRTIQEVFETARVEEVVRDFLNLKPKGSNLTGLCPFHDEKTPSFMVSPTKNIFKCFGCGRGGGAVQFVMEHERYTYPEAIRYLAKKYNIDIEETQRSDEQLQEMQEIESLHLINEFAKTHFIENLFDTEDGRTIGLSYFKERGYLESTIRQFGLGYARNDSKALQNAAQDRGFQEDRLRELGLITKNGNDFFRGRVIFPIHNLSGKVIGFGGRTMREGKKEPKYINSVESRIYNKRKAVYGLFEAKHSVRKHDLCYLVEGYTDVLSLAQSGITNVVSSSGTALTKDQIKAIKRFTRNITVVYDGDEAGIKAALRGLDLMLEEDVLVRLVLLPEQHDPDSLLRSLGAQAFKEYLDQEAKDFILFKAGFLSKESENDPIRKSIVIRDIVESLALVPDAIRRAMYLQECARLLAIDERILVQETNNAIRSNLKQRRLQDRRAEIRTDFTQQQTTPMPSRPATQDDEQGIAYSDEYQERDIIRVLVNYGDQLYSDEDGISVAQYVINNISDVMDTFDNPFYARIAGLFAEGLTLGRVPSQDELVQHPDPEISGTVVEILATPFEYSPNWHEMKHLPLVSQKMPDQNYVEDAYQAILAFKHHKIDRKISENQELIQKFNAAGDEEMMRLHINVHKELKRIKSEVGEELNSIGIRL
ncbi:MAG: DNA primase [Saprospiraceae bacterium]|nr:DNA primase [Saprospiraceae bacterium]